MAVLRYIFCPLYRVWFYVLATLPIVFLFPILLLSISREQWYPFFFRLARFWAKFILIGMGFRWKINKEQQLEQGKSYMFIANHTSMIDIMLMLVSVKNPFVFVGKKELVKIPLFGFFYKRVVIMVDRSSPKSRKDVFLKAQKRLQSGLSICIFPEGKVPEENIVLDEFKDGAFKLAINHKIPIIPLTFYDNKKRLSYNIFSGGPGELRVKIHKYLNTNNLVIEDTKELNYKARQILLNELKKD